MVGAEATIVGTAVSGGCVEGQGHLARLEISSTTLVVLDVCCDEDLLLPVLGTPFQHVNVFILEDYLSLNPRKAGGAERGCEIVKDIVAALCSAINFWLCHESSERGEVNTVR